MSMCLLWWSIVSMIKGPNASVWWKEDLIRYSRISSTVVPEAIRAFTSVRGPFSMYPAGIGSAAPL